MIRRSSEIVMQTADSSDDRLTCISSISNAIFHSLSSVRTMLESSLSEFISSSNEKTHHIARGALNNSFLLVCMFLNICSRLNKYWYDLFQAPPIIKTKPLPITNNLKIHHLKPLLNHTNIKIKFNNTIAN